MANAILAAILALIIPGLGQLYEGQETKKWVLFLVIAIILYALQFMIPYVNIVLLIFAIYSAYDAYKYAKDNV